jgi:hypothetical protein
MNRWASGRATPRVESLLKQLHLDQHDRLPDVVGEADAAAVGWALADTLLVGAAGLLGALLSEGLEEAVEEDLGLALLIAGDVLPGPGDEVGQLLRSGFGHRQSSASMPRIAPVAASNAAACPSDQVPASASKS